MQIVTTPNEILVKKSETVTKFDKKLTNLITEMETTLLATKDPVGVGLAAPQVGVSLRIFQMKPSGNSKTTTYINPEITDQSQEEGILLKKNSKTIEELKPKKSKDKLLEGCLSIPNIWGNVSRKREVTLNWQDINGIVHVKKFTGFPATIIQHEVDHLNGILFTTHVLAQKEQLYKSHKNKNGEDEFEEITI